MAGPHGKYIHPLIEQFLADPWQRDFFLMLRQIECLCPDRPRIGRSHSILQDPIRLTQHVSLAFATSTLAQPEIPPREGRAPKLAVRFTGLTGPNGPLPLRLTEFIRNRLRGVYDADLVGTRSDTPEERGYTAPRDSTPAAFLDVFHHRFISLFYRAWAVAQKSVDLDRSDDQCFTHWIGSFFGCCLKETDGVDAVSTLHKLAFAGHLSCQTRHAFGLQQLLETDFRMPVALSEFMGHWLRIPEERRCRLGESPETGRLGATCLVGRSTWDRQLKFSLRAGPMGYADFEGFLPGGDNHARLHSWVAFYTRREFAWEAAIVLKKEEVPRTKLGTSGRLGYTVWTSSRAFGKDVDDYRIRGGEVNPEDNS